MPSLTRRRRWFAAAASALALAVGPGCRALGVSPAKLDPIAAPPPSLAVTTLIDRHNANADKVTSLEATPSVSDRKIGAAQGQMALVRPSDFRLTLSTSVRGRLADLGSNGDEFWIWTSQSKEKEFFVGRFDSSGQLAPGLIFQPDWITEAMGLRVISEREKRAVTTDRGDSSQTITLVHHRTGPDGQETIKKTLVDRQSGLIREHQFLAPDGQTVIARALPSDYRTVPIASTDATSGAAEKASVVLPYYIRLIAQPPGQEAMAWEIKMSGTKVNQFAEDRRVKLFALPDYANQGYVRVDLDQRIGSTAGAGAETIRETRPSPPLSTRIELQAPVPLGVDGEAMRTSDPMPLAADLPGPGSIDTVIRARVPRPAGEPITPVPVQRSQLGQFSGGATIR
jgi:hypothetical protein